MGLTIIIPCKDRAQLLKTTLDSYRQLNNLSSIDYEIIILSNVLNEDVKNLIFDYINKYNMNLNYAVYDWKDLSWIAPCRAFNYGANLAKYDNIALTSPEIQHNTPGILEYCATMKEDCVMTSCWDLNPDGSRRFHLYHTGYRGDSPGYYFFGCYKKDKFLDIGGMDEKFMDGVAWDDCDFGDRWLRAGYSFVLRDDFVVEHQYHPRRGDILDDLYYLNKRHYDYNTDNKIIKVNNNV